MGRCSCKQLMNNLSMVAMIDRSQPQFLRLSSSIRASYCRPKTNFHEIPSSSLFDGFIKTTRRMGRFYKRTFSEYVPSSMLVKRPKYSCETDEAVHYFIGMCGIADDNVKISVENNKSVTIIGEGDGVFEATHGFKKYVCYIDLPDIDSPVKMYTTRGIKADMVFQTAMVEIIIPKLKKPDDENETAFNNNNNIVKLNRTYGDDEDNDEEDFDEDSYLDFDEEEDDGCKCDGKHNNVTLTRCYDCVMKLYLYCKMKVVSFGRLPIINRCVVILSWAVKRCSISITVKDGSLGYRVKHNLQRARNVTLYRISNFIYTNIMNRFGLVKERAYSMGYTEIKASPHETDEWLYYNLQMNGVISHEKVRVFVDHNVLSVCAVVFDEFKATYHSYHSHIKLPEDSYYLNYKMRGIKAEFSEGELKLSIPKLNAAERMMMNENKDEFLKLKEDAFVFDIKVTEKKDEAGEYVIAAC